MSGFNKVTIMGRLGKDPEVKYTASGTAICSISVATSEKWKDKDSGNQEERTEWHRVTFFGKKGEAVAEYFKKGSNILLTGKLQTDKWEKDGQTHSITKIIADEFVFVDSASGATRQQSGAGGFRDHSAAAAPPSQPKQQSFDNDFQDDDIPF